MLACFGVVISCIQEIQSVVIEEISEITIFYNKNSVYKSKLISDVFTPES